MPRLSPDGALLATGSSDRTAALVDAASGEVRHRLTHHTASVVCLAFSPDGALLATGSRDGTAALHWMRGDWWSPGLHRYLPRAAQKALVTVLLCARRISQGRGYAATSLPALPPEMWLAILGFISAESLLRM